jgi:topoisomerase-4 subunit A
VEEMIEVKGWKALGNKINFEKILEVKMLEPEIDTEEDENEVNIVASEDFEVVDSEVTDSEVGNDPENQETNSELENKEEKNNQEADSQNEENQKPENHEGEQLGLF